MYSLTFREFNSIKDKLKDAIAQNCRSIYDSTCNFDIKAYNFGGDDDKVETLCIICKFDSGNAAAQHIPLRYDHINNCWICTAYNKYIDLSTITNNTIKQMRYKNLSDSVGNAVTTREIEKLFD